MFNLTDAKLDKRCKLCRMSFWNQELFLKVHELRINGGYSSQKIQAFLNHEISEFNKTVKPQDQQTFISDSALANHFKMHIPTAHQVNAQIKQAITAVHKEPLPILAEKAIKSYHQKADAENADEFKKFTKLVDQVARRFSQLEKQIDAQNKDGKKDLTSEQIMQFKALAELLGKFRKDTIQLRNQDRILQTALTSVMDTYSINALQNLLKSLDLLLSEFRLDFKNPAKADEFASKFRSSLGEIMISAARTALESVRNQLKTG